MYGRPFFVCPRKGPAAERLRLALPFACCRTVKLTSSRQPRIIGEEKKRLEKRERVFERSMGIPWSEIT